MWLKGPATACAGASVFVKGLEAQRAGSVAAPDSRFRKSHQGMTITVRSFRHALWWVKLDQVCTGG
jgi:hypothetical protein|tara:strand:+ start:17830 stop:18027 length:198 start_codon:yes stop_codon:yes gene_type:complete